MIFDAQYEPSLQMRLEEKRDLLRRAIAVRLLYDGELAGEAYGEPLGDTNDADASSLYVFARMQPSRTSSRTPK